MQYFIQSFFPFSLAFARFEKLFLKLIRKMFFHYIFISFFLSPLPKNAHPFGLFVNISFSGWRRKSLLVSEFESWLRFMINFFLYWQWCCSFFTFVMRNRILWKSFLWKFFMLDISLKIQFSSNLICVCESLIFLQIQLNILQSKYLNILKTFNKR